MADRSGRINATNVIVIALAKLSGTRHDCGLGLFADLSRLRFNVADTGDTAICTPRAHARDKDK